MDPVTGALVGWAVEKSADLLYEEIKERKRRERAIEAQLEIADEEAEQARLDAALRALTEQYDWGEVPPNERPNTNDVKNRLNDVGRAYEGSYDAKHRKMIAAAFFRSFDPKYYTTGMHKILWDYVVKLTYPEARFLQSINSKVEAQIKEHRLEAAEINDGKNTVWNAGAVIVRPASVDYVLAHRLHELKLVTMKVDGFKAQVMPWRGIVAALMEYLWGDDAEHVLEATTGVPK